MPDTTAPNTAAGFPIDFADDIDEAARREITALLYTWNGGLFAAGTAAIRQLPGGANNQNYVVTSGAFRYALRIANQDNNRMAVDRDSARRAQADAARIGIAPAVMAHCGSLGHLLSEFVEGNALSVGTVAEPTILATIAQTFRSLHAAQSTCRQFDPFADIEMWVTHAARQGEPIPAEVHKLRTRAAAVRDAVATLGLPKLFCHNDTVPQNFLWDGTKIVLVDWDYAGHFFAAFELGSFICTADLTDEHRRLFLHAYAPALDEPAHARIRLMQFVAALREVAWVLNSASMLRGTTMVSDSFYDDYLTNNLRRASRFGLSSEFDSLLGTASRLDTSTTV